MSETPFVILKEDRGDFIPFGLVAQPLTLNQARAEAVALALQYPDQKFHVFADCGAALHEGSIVLELQNPDLSTGELKVVTAPA
jgi:hypothetical protein